jgi:hypothetical protein
VYAYWEGLLRGGADMPFADDFNPTALPDLVDRMMLIDVFERPARLRFQSVGEALTSEPLAGRFLDELRLGPPFEFLASQCGVTTEAAAPTFWRAQAGRLSSRLLLPLWGDGHIDLLLGVVDLSSAHHPSEAPTSVPSP